MLGKTVSPILTHEIAIYVTKIWSKFWAQFFIKKFFTADLVLFLLTFSEIRNALIKLSRAVAKTYLPSFIGNPLPKVCHVDAISAHRNMFFCVRCPFVGVSKEQTDKYEICRRLKKGESWF